MMKSEFDILVGKDTAPEEYELIEFVYTWHPSNLSKEATASLYREFGLTIFKDMEQRAIQAQVLEEKIHKAEIYIRDLRKELRELK